MPLARISKLTLENFDKALLFAIFIVCEMAGEGKSDELTMVANYIVVEKGKVERITEEIMASLSNDSSDSKEFDFEEDNGDVEDIPLKPSHVIFGESTMKKGHIEVLKIPIISVIL
jgi:hypothetical protein